LRAVAADAGRRQPSARAGTWRRALGGGSAAARPNLNRYCVYTYPSGKAIKAVTATVKTICRRTVNQPRKHHRIAFHCGRSLVGA
jgi:hypothetical protein